MCNKVKGLVVQLCKRGGTPDANFFLVMVKRAVEGVQKQCVGMGRGFSLTEFFLLAVQED